RLRGEILLRLKRLPEAEKNLQDSLKINNQCKLTYYLLGVVYVLQKKWYQAVETLQMAEKLGYSTAKFYHRLGQASFNMENYEKSSEAYEKAATLWTEKTEGSRVTVADLYYMAGLSCDRIHDEIASRKFYKLAIANDERHSSEILGIGIFHDRFKEYDLAI